MKVFRWWRAQKVERPLLRGAVFWGMFWSVSAAAIVWVYAPGGIGDPDRGARVRVAPKRVARCVVACADQPSDGSPAAAGPVEVGSKPDEPGPDDPRPSPSLSAPPIVLPKFVPPTITLNVIDQFVLAGNRYAEYQVVAKAGSKLSSVTIMTDVPAKTWFVECNDQAGQSVCIDQYAGEDEAHRLSWPLANMAAGETKAFTFAVRIDASVAEGETIRDHAHLAWPEGAVRSSTHSFAAPAISLS